MAATKSSFLDKVLGRLGRLDTEGLQTVVQRLARERALLETLFNTIEDGVLVERTRDYYAQDTDGNVWYMGEDSVAFEYDDDGNLTGTSTEGSWRAGRNKARPGYAMPATPELGFRYFQEFAPKDEALDQAAYAHNKSHFDPEVVKAMR